MKILCPLHTAAFIALLCSTAAAESTYLMSVFKMYPLRPLYETARAQRTEPPEAALATDSAAKKTICKNIITSEYFGRHQELEEVDLRKHFKDLKEKPHYQDIFKQMYKKITHPNTEETYEYTNDYIALDETTAIYELGDEEFHVAEEAVFMCLTWSPENERIYPLYVSREYNTSTLIPNVSGQYTAGRFIFQGSIQRLNLLAVAEEPGKFFDNLVVEKYYLFIRENRPEDAWEDKDAFCNQIQRTRFCSSIFNSRHFRGRYMTLPSYEPVPCFRKKVSFHATDVNDAVAGKDFFEWMTYCDVWTKNVRTRYFASRGYNPHHVIVYHAVDKTKKDDIESQEAYLEAVFTNISIGVQ